MYNSISLSSVIMPVHINDHAFKKIFIFGIPLLYIFSSVLWQWFPFSCLFAYVSSDPVPLARLQRFCGFKAPTFGLTIQSVRHPRLMVVPTLCHLILHDHLKLLHALLWQQTFIQRFSSYLWHPRLEMVTLFQGTIEIIFLFLCWMTYKLSTALHLFVLISQYQRFIQKSWVPDTRYQTATAQSSS